MTTIFKLTEQQKSLLKQVGIIEIGNEVTDLSTFVTLLLEIIVEQKDEVEEIKGIVKEFGKMLSA